MKITSLVAGHIADVVHGNWTEIYLDDVIADVTYAEAVNVLPGAGYTIAALLYHIAFYNNIVLQRLQGGHPKIDGLNGFDVHVNSAEEWLALKQNSLSAFKQLAAYVEAMPVEQLWQTTGTESHTFYKSLHGIAEHAHYHLGQIVLLKKLIRYNGHAGN
jgi:uncharacterized damage-inducible protein DinB